MKVTSTEEYGLRCLLALAHEHATGRGGLTLPEIASREGLPVPNTAKLLRKLRLAGVLESARGRTGGYTLSRPPEQISLAEVVTALDGSIFQHQHCAQFTGSEPVCVHTGDCSVRSVWVAVQTLVHSALEKVSLADLAFKESEARERLRTSWLTEADLAAAWGPSKKTSGKDRDER